MKISVNWMQMYAGDVKIMPKGGIDELVRKIGAQLGAVEEVVDLSKKYQGIVVAKVVACEKHPNADRLSVCRVDDGQAVKGVKRDGDGLVQVVCGAPNVREGLLVAWLPPGAIVPKGYDRDPFVLDAREIRGVVSNGMLASASELDINDDHSGILELNEGRPGDEFAKLFGLDDYVIEIENKMFTHRPDCFGILGVAREIAGITGQKFVSPKAYTAPEAELSTRPGNFELQVKNGAPELVPRLLAQVFEGVSVGPSPVWLQTYLSRVGIRPINNIVDITNYYMLLTGQPLHAYDADKLRAMSGQQTTDSREQVADNRKQVADSRQQVTDSRQQIADSRGQGAVSIEARKSKKGEKLKLLNGKTVEFEDDTVILITSNDVPVGVGGVMGGADTEVDETTTNIVLECANFDMYSIRRTAMELGLFTEAVTRFNKGQSPLQCDRVLTWAGADIVRHCGARPGEKRDEKSRLAEPPAVKITADFINERLGLKLSLKQITELLTNVEFSVKTAPADKKHLHVKAPFWRTDIRIPEDVVEEVGRLYGYDHLPLELPRRSMRPAKRDEQLALKSRLRDILSRAGANEVLTYSFVHGDLIDKAGQDSRQAFKLVNALSPDLQYYRLSLTPNLLGKVRPNIKAGFDELAIFEIGKAHNKGVTCDDGLPDEIGTIELVYAAKHDKPGAAYYQALKYADHLLKALGIDYHLEPAQELLHQIWRPFEPKRTGMIKAANGGTLGVVGELRPEVQHAFKLPPKTAAFTLALEPLEHLAAQAGQSYVPLSKFPKVEQDISLKVSQDLTYGQIAAELQAGLAELADDSLHTELAPLDIYQADESKHFTFRLTATHYQKTLRAAEINDLLDELAERVKQKFGAERL